MVRFLEVFVLTGVFKSISEILLLSTPCQTLHSLPPGSLYLYKAYMSKKLKFFIIPIELHISELVL